MRNIALDANYPRELYRAYFEIQLIRIKHEADPTLVRHDWIAKIISREPTGYAWNGAVVPTWPADVPLPAYPSCPTQAEFKALEDAAPGSGQAAVNAWRAECSRIYESNPKALHLLEQGEGSLEDWLPAEESEQAARLESQQWVLDRIETYRKEAV